MIDDCEDARLVLKGGGKGVEDWEEVEGSAAATRSELLEPKTLEELGAEIISGEGEEALGEAEGAPAAGLDARLDALEGIWRGEN